jgi:hypothetical protein
VRAFPCADTHTHTHTHMHAHTPTHTHARAHTQTWLLDGRQGWVRTKARTFMKAIRGFVTRDREWSKKWGHSARTANAPPSLSSAYCHFATVEDASMSTRKTVLDSATIFCRTSALHPCMPGHSPSAQVGRQCAQQVVPLIVHISPCPSRIHALTHAHTHTHTHTHSLSLSLYLSLSPCLIDREMCVHVCM